MLWGKYECCLMWSDVCFQASFVASGNRTDISLDDPNFWDKWAKKADIDMDMVNGRVRSNSPFLYLSYRKCLDIVWHLDCLQFS